MLSGPAQYVSGGAARVRVVVPESVALNAVTVTLDGADVTSLFAADDRAPHALEGVLTGLPLGPSEVEASVPGPGRSANDRTTLTLVNYPITGPMFEGPKQPNFFCSTASATWPASGSPARSSTTTARYPTRTDYYYRASNNTWKPFDASAPRPADMTQTTTSDGQTVDFVIRWERGTIDRFIYTIAVLDPTESGPSSLPYWNRKLIYYFGGGVAIGHYQGSNNQDESRYPYGLGKGYAIAWSTGTKTNTHYNLVLGGETALMVKSRFVTEYDDPTTRSASAARAAGSSSTSTARTIPVCSTARSRSTRTRTWSRRRSMSATASCSSTGWTCRCSRTRLRSGASGRTVPGSRGSRARTRSRTRTSR